MKKSELMIILDNIPGDPEVKVLEYPWAKQIASVKADGDIFLKLGRSELIEDGD